MVPENLVKGTDAFVVCESMQLSYDRQGLWHAAFCSVLVYLLILCLNYNDCTAGCFAVPHCGVVLCTAAAAQSLLQGAVCMHAAPSVSMACHDMHDGTGSLPTHGSVKDTSCENEHLRCMLRMRESRVTDLAKQGVVGVLDLRGSGVHTAEHASVEACSSKRAVVGTSGVLMPYPAFK